MFITENQLDQWVRGNAREAQGTIVELVWRLVAASSPKPKERRFPLGDSIGQHGPDGLLDVDYSYEPFVPEGRSYWEIGTGIDAKTKANNDYRDSIVNIPGTIRSDSTFVFLTPLSGRRDWQFTWKSDAQETWTQDRINERHWKDVKVIDGTKIIDWLSHFPSVELWLAEKICGIHLDNIQTPEQHWKYLQSIGEPPPLPPKLFLANREDAVAKIQEICSGLTIQVNLETHYPMQIVDFVAAALESLNKEDKADILGRCLIVSKPDEWNTIINYKDRHIIIADSTLDLSGELGTKLIQKARRAGHAIIFGSPVGGIPDPTSVHMPPPRIHQLQEALENCGYSEERARTLAHKSGGNIHCLLRCILNLSLMPEWAESGEAADLAIAAFLGEWNEATIADREVVKSLSGKEYGEWIEKMRELSLRPATPLIQDEGKWKFIARYEGWYSLGCKLFDEHLDRFRIASISALTENDPQFDLPPDKRYASAIYGKHLTHSHLLRKGLAESLALLGSHPLSLTSCTLGKPEDTAAFVVREILFEANWVRWASLNDLLPLLAEAAPRQFLDAVEEALAREECPFDELFLQEGDAFSGGTYISGLLWSLETLAWSSDYLSRAIMCLGELAARDPGGRWANRPANSLTTILLPWMPQTCSPLPKRVAAITTLLDEIPEVGWKLLLSLLPNSHTTSSGSRRPAWRQFIPEDWSRNITDKDYWKQVNIYCDMAINVIKDDQAKLIDLINVMDNLTPSTINKILLYLESKEFTNSPEDIKSKVWSELLDIITKHKKYSEANWAMPSTIIDLIINVAEKISPQSPTYRHQRLFGERDIDLYERMGNYEEQQKKIELMRTTAVDEIYKNGGIQSLLDFSATVASAWRVGSAFSNVAKEKDDEEILPSLLCTNNQSYDQFTRAFIRGKFHLYGWTWVDRLNISHWTPDQIGLFLASLPFVPETWNISTKLLGKDDALYWKRTNANPYETETGLALALAPLLYHKRPAAALDCIERMLHDQEDINSALAVQALLDLLKSPETLKSASSFRLVTIIKHLQNNPDVSEDDILKIEWSYLKLLDMNDDAFPKFLWTKLAKEPSFFSEVIRLVFRSKNENPSKEEMPPATEAIATNAYELLTKWRLPPGSQADGTYDDKALNLWLDGMKVECAKTGHLEVAMTILGHSLVYAPADPNGLWIHRAAASILNSKDSKDMREGFRTELFNSRGVYSFTGGKEEHKLAETYRSKADEIETAGFPRIATTLKDLASTYDREAQRAARKGKHNT